MALLSEVEAKAIIDRVLARSKAEHCQVFLNEGSRGNIRFARNAVSTSGSMHNSSLAVTASFGKRSGTSSINSFDDASIARMVARAEELAHLAPEDPEFMPPLGPQKYATGNGWAQSTINLDPERRAAIAQAGLDAAKAKGCVAAGYLDHSDGISAMGNSKGLFAYDHSTSAGYSVTMRTEDGLGSGFGTTDSHDASRLDVAGVSRIAAEKAVASHETRAVEPGKYTVILEPAAAVDLVQYLLLSMDARSAEEGRSFLSKQGGTTRIGEKLLDERVNIYSDPLDPTGPATTWNGDGRPLERTSWIEKGVVKNMSYSRFWAAKRNVPALSGPANFLMSGGTASTEELIRGTERGILVTRLWYIRPVDPQTLLFTGLTRDGTFYIENGKIAYAVKNFRFNESPVIMLNNVDALGAPIRVRNAETALASVIPPMRIRDFTFSSLSDAV
ncbi:MAG: TldD/PmbA family protein [Gemmatimonadales bacterium]